MADGIKGLPRIWRATKVSYWGLGWALRNEEAFQIELALAVLITELLNSGIEVTIDRIGKELHPLSGAAKDLGSAAVHLSLVQVPVVWALVLL
jgi:diacylglycerol kinase (ATP)